MPTQRVKLLVAAWFVGDKQGTMYDACTEDPEIAWQAILEILQRDLRFVLMGPPQRLYSNFIRGIRSLPVRIVN